MRFIAAKPAKKALMHWNRCFVFLRTITSNSKRMHTKKFSLHSRRKRIFQLLRQIQHFFLHFLIRWRRKEKNKKFFFVFGKKTNKKKLHYCVFYCFRITQTAFFLLQFRHCFFTAVSLFFLYCSFGSAFSLCRCCPLHFFSAARTLCKWYLKGLTGLCQKNIRVKALLALISPSYIISEGAFSLSYMFLISSLYDPQ